ncbi:hypothetical protein CAPTEDRAFT_224942 [Capitella teleta]|uniref:Fatty acid synthase n=1 Tax=Capitella teleta TaxID=283909 RepID=R7TWT8_CAPTE|nr:hypothetical protein CAPTEDRAFT_224942 [Capitella teleta]|eukprot:ELT98363.1 hypothetical protein CAPTEDRAFT_224942 [Capitella teleta]
MANWLRLRSRRMSTYNTNDLNVEEHGLPYTMFMRQAKETPDRIAVLSPGEKRQMTYKELDHVTDVLAKHLRICGVKEESVVGIYMEKCLDFTISYIATLKAGGAYMPIDISFPKTFIEFMISDAQPVVICTSPALIDKLPCEQKTITMDSDWIATLQKTNEQHPGFTSAPDVTLDSLAYIVYSSGTTGKPKGVKCPHRGSAIAYHYRYLVYPYSKDDQREASNIFFIYEMFRPLLKGATLIIVPDTIIYDPVLLSQFLRKHRISRMMFTPSLLEAVLGADVIDVKNAFQYMRVVIFCGEVVTTRLLDRCMKALPSVKFLDMYGSSEAHDVAIADLSEWYQELKGNVLDKKFCTVGKLLPGTQVFIMNDEMEAQPVGVAGQIYIGGPSLAIGYLNQPELTRARFITQSDVCSDKIPRLHKSGDWGYLLSNGSLKVCGRCDSMVKIRGYSIETQSLIAYVVPENLEDKVTKKDVRAALKKVLPLYMIPSYFVLLESLPMHANSGKVNKNVLPSIGETEGSDVNPDGLADTPTEKALVLLWEEILGTKSVDIHESFFDMGGHSLLATKLLSRVRSKFNVDFTVQDLFTHPSVSAMAKQIDIQQTGDPNNFLSPELMVDLIAEVDKHHQTPSLDIQIRAFWRGERYGKQWSRTQVLLTGATGFLGAFLLRDLLLTTNCHVYCLLRGSPNLTVEERLKKTLEGFGILKRDGRLDDPMKAIIESRVTSIAGDVGLFNMGLSMEDYNFLSTEIDAIIHAAAHVNLIYPYQGLHGPNVIGTQNIIKFAWTNKVKALHHVSTAAVFPSGVPSCTEESDMKIYADQLTDGYSETKWVAEQLVLKAIGLGLPAVVYRPGYLSGESEHGEWNPQNFILLMIQGCIHAGMAPKIPWDIEMTPVSFVSGFIVDMTQRLPLALGKIFHLVNCNTIKSQWLFEWIHRHGYPLRMVSFDEWAKKIESQGQEGNKSSQILSQLIGGMVKDESFFANSRVYTQENTTKILETLGKSYPRINDALLNAYFEGMSQRGVIPKKATSDTSGC